MTQELITPTRMDLDGMMEAARTLSSETTLGGLLATMMGLVMSESGATNALLLIKQEEDWIVQARGDLASSSHDILLNQRLDPADPDDEGVIPELVFNYCRGAQKTFVVGDARVDPRLAEDRMVAAKNIRSMACISVESQGELIAILYLENNQTVDVFTPERVRILQHLFAQFSVLVDNVALHHSLTQKFEELREIQERFQLAAEGAAAGIWDWNILSDDVYVSDRTKELLGYTSDELTLTLEEFRHRVHPDDYKAAHRALDEHLNKRVPYRADFRLRVKSGEYRWFHARGQAMWSDAGRATRVSGSLTDITSRKLAEENLLKSEERFRSLMEQSPLAIEILTPDGRINQVNAAWKRLWNVNEEQAAQVLATYNMLTDKQVEDLGVLPQVKRAFAGERIVLPPIMYSASQAAEDLGLDFEARVPWIQCHLYPVKDEKGRVAYVVNTYLDITEVKRADKEAQKHRDALARMDRATSMGQLTGSIAHELNQPLTGILSNAQAGEMMIKLGRADQDELAEILDAIAGDAKRAGDVIRGLQELYREHKLESNPVDLNALIEETTELLHSEFIIKEVKLTTACAPSIPVIKGNRIQLQQVLVNLVMNGIQAMTHLSPSDRRLHIEMTCDSNEVRAWVEDRGRGIDADKIGTIFEPLTTWKPGGTGMGLAICKSIIEVHGGTMWSENLPAGGARVGFTVPVPEGDQQA